MAKQLVPMLIKIGLKAEKGQSVNDYPDFNKLQCVIDSGLDWSYYLDVYGTGWHYDHSCGHAGERADGDKFDSPHGKWMGLVLVPEIFGQEAEAMFPEVIDALTEEEAEDFYDHKHSVRIPDQTIDDKIIAAIAVRQNAGLTLSQKELDAIDPEKSQPGIVDNPMKTFVGMKAKKDLTVTMRKAVIK